MYRALAIAVLLEVETYLKSDHFIGGGSIVQVEIPWSYSIVHRALLRISLRIFREKLSFRQNAIAVRLMTYPVPHEHYEGEFEIRDKPLLWCSYRLDQRVRIRSEKMMWVVSSVFVQCQSGQGIL